jgi:hypothetical protein
MLGRIAIYASSSYTYSGVVTAYGGSGPSVNANGAAGTIYVETGSGSLLSRKLICDNGGMATNEMQRTILSDKAPSGSNVVYSLDELNIVGKARFGLMVANSDAAFRTFLNVVKVTGDGTGDLQALAYTQISFLTVTLNASVFSTSFVSWQPSSSTISQSTEVHYAMQSLLLNTTNVLIYSSGRVVMPPSVVVSDVTLRCQGDLFGVLSLTARSSGHVMLYTSGRTSALFAQNYYSFDNVQLLGFSDLSLIHDKVVSTQLMLVATSSVILRDTTTIYTTGQVQIQTPVMNMSAATTTLTAAGTGFTSTMSNVNCPQTAGNQGLCL